MAARRAFDCMLYNGEVEVLEIRLHELDPIIDRFVVVESDTTFSGKPRALAFDPNHPAIAPFAHKIDHVVVRDMPNTTNPWEREAWQRNALIRGVANAADSDLIVMSDVDEIPRAAIIAYAKFETRHSIYLFRLRFYYFFLNYMNTKGPEVGQICNSASTVGIARQLGPQNFRHKLIPGAVVIDDGGWHFSYLMDEASVKKKIAAFAHQELNTDAVLNSIDIPAFVARGADLFNRPGYEWKLTDGSDLPYWVMQNRQMLPALFHDQLKIDPPRMLRA
jgi:Glycosyltransferase family 17